MAAKTIEQKFEEKECICIIWSTRQYILWYVYSDLYFGVEEKPWAERQYSVYWRQQW